MFVFLTKLMLSFTQLSTFCTWNHVSCIVAYFFFFLLLVSLVVFTHFPCCFFSLQRANLVVRSVFDLTGGVFVVCCYLILWCCVFGSCLNQFSRALAQEWHCLAGVYVYLCMYQMIPNLLKWQLGSAFPPRPYKFICAYACFHLVICFSWM